MPPKLPLSTWIKVAPVGGIIVGLFAQSWLGGFVGWLMLMVLGWLFQERPESTATRPAAAATTSAERHQRKPRTRSGKPSKTSRWTDWWIVNGALIFIVGGLGGAVLAWFGFAEPAIHAMQFRQRDDLLVVQTDDLTSQCIGKGCSTKNYYATFTVGDRTYEDVPVAGTSPRYLESPVVLLVAPENPRHAQVTGQNDTPQLILASLMTALALFISGASIPLWRRMRRVARRMPEFAHD